MARASACATLETKTTAHNNNHFVFNGTDVVVAHRTKVLATGGPKEADGARRRRTEADEAPEQLTGGPIGPRSDFCALGVILNESATGSRPHEEASLGSLVYASAHKPPTR